jgi:hypothetical protein
MLRDEALDQRAFTQSGLAGDEHQLAGCAPRLLK